MSKCNICGEHITLPQDGVALMIAFVHGSTTTLSNVAICNWCYKEYGVNDAIKMLNTSACLHIKFPEEES